MGEKENSKYTLYIGGDPIGEVKELNVDTPMEEKNTMRVSAPSSGSFTVKTINVRLAMLSFVYGRKVTNNWLKLHGGIMVRKRGKRGRRKR